MYPGTAVYRYMKCEHVQMKQISSNYLLFRPFLLHLPLLPLLFPFPTPFPQKIILSFLKTRRILFKNVTCILIIYYISSLGAHLGV